MRIVLTTSVALAAYSTAVGAQEVINPKEYERFDLNRDSWMDRAELTNFARSDDPKRKQAENDDLVDDILTVTCPANCTRVTFDEFVIFLQDRARRRTGESKKKRTPLWQGFAISREVVDAINPRADKSKAPAILSIKWNEEASNSKDKRQETILGGVQLLSLGIGERRSQISLSPGLDFDLDGSKDKTETTITAGLPVEFLQIRDADKFIESFTVGLTPKLITDRPFKRKVYEVAVTTGFSSKPLAAGFIRPAPVRRDGIHLPPITWYWVPSAQLEIGKVDDAGGNAKLVPFEGESYVRLAPRAKITMSPNVISERLQLGIDYVNRFDLREGWNRPMVEGRLTYDLVFNGAAELTLIHRRGRKPPQFSRIKDVLLGIGLRL